jgi:hypothetical protein
MKRPTIRVLFYIRRERTRKNGESTIMMRITVNGQREELTTSRSILAERWVEKTEAVTTLCRNIATNVKPRALRHWDGQLKSAWSDHRIRFFQL